MSVGDRTSTVPLVLRSAHTFTQPGPPLRAALLIATLLLAGAPARADDKKLVVLPLDISKTGGKMDVNARASVEEMLRDAAINALSENGWTVLDANNTIELLRSNNIDPSLCEGSCHLETARKVAADAFVSGLVQWSDGEFTASVRLLDTQTGRPLASERVTGATAKALRDGFWKERATFFMKLIGTAAPTPERSAAGGTTAVGKGSLKLITTPPGASVLIDGDDVGRTPVTLPREAGTYAVTLELLGYSAVARNVEVTAGKTALVNETLLKAAGYLEVSIEPAEASKGAIITIDGKAAGSGRQGPLGLGRHTVRVVSPGYKAAESVGEVENGVASPVHLTLDALPGKLLISVNVEADCRAGTSTVHASAGQLARLEVRPGHASVTCTRAGYEDASAEADVPPGKSAQVKVALKRPEGPSAGAVRIEPKSGLPFVYLPGGTFHFGCEPQDKECSTTEKPGRSALLGGFWLGKTAVTVAAYAKCVAASACSDRPQNEVGYESACNWKHGRLDHSMNCVNWEEAGKFCAWVGARLPTAEEREYAAKGGQSRIFPWGGQPWTAERANVAGEQDGYKHTSPVGNFPKGASAQGLLDLAGNVFDWTASDFSATDKEMRGGCWYAPPSHARASYRSHRAPTKSHTSIGFRCAQ